MGEKLQIYSQTLAERLEPRTLFFIDGLPDPFYVYAGTDAEHGTELWMTQRAGEVGVLLKDIVPGPASSWPDSFSPRSATTHYFVAEAQSGDREIWFYGNGKTYQVKDINPGIAGSNPQNLTRVGSNLVFIANDGSAADPQVYVSDSTEENTHRLLGNVTTVGPVTFTLEKANRLRIDASVDVDGELQPRSWITDGKRLAMVPYLDNGILYIDGNENDDSFYVTYHPTVDEIYLRYNVNDLITTDLPMSQIAGARIRAFGGNDAVWSPKVPATVWGGTGDDKLTGSDGAVLHGGDGNDQLTGWGAANLIGESGNDTLTGDFGATMDGGDGSDTLDFSLFYTPITKDYLVTGVLDLGDRGTVSYSNAEAIIGGHADDQIAIDNSIDSVRVLEGREGNDWLLIAGVNPAANVPVSIYGGEGDDTIQIDRGNGGHAYYFGENGNDVFRIGSARTNRNFYGGNGIDTVQDYGSYATAGILITLDDKTGDGPYGGDNVHSDIEFVYGTPWNDTLVGNDQSETLVGGAGHDCIVGNGGNDCLMGQDGNDTLIGGAGDDSIDGSTGNNTIIEDMPPPVAGVLSFTNSIFKVAGSDSPDVIIVRRRPSNAKMLEVLVNGVPRSYRFSDVSQLAIDGKGGNDSITFDFSVGSVTFGIQLRGGAGDDAISGSSGTDWIDGGAGNDWINSQGGNDTIYGGVGNDRLFGGDGNDYLNGGAGTDLLRGGNGIDRIVAAIGLDDTKGNKGDSLVNDIVN